MRTLVLCDNAEPEKVIPLCKKYHLGIEIQGFYNPNETENRDKLISLYKSILPLDILKYFHAPFWDLCLGSANKKIAEITRYYFDYAYETARELGCAGVTVHHGFVPNTSYPENWIKRAVVFWDDFLKAHPGGIEMYMENQCELDTKTLIGIVDACRDSRLSVNLDIGHAHCNSGLPVTDWIKQLGSRIRYTHIHQNNGISDEHLGLRYGNMPLRDVMETLDEYAPEAVWALECDIDHMEESIMLLSEWRYVQQ